MTYFMISNYLFDMFLRVLTVYVSHTMVEMSS